MPKQKHRENPFVRCPYYKYERELPGDQYAHPSVIYCEGCGADSSIHMAFASGTRRRQYEKRLCQDRWQGCIIADALSRKWEAEA